MNPERLETGERARRTIELAEALQAEKDDTPLPDGRNPEQMKDSLEELVRRLAPKAERAFPGISAEAVRGLCSTINAMGTRGIESEDWLTFFLLVRHGHRVTPLQVREAVRVLGHGADLFVLGWAKGHHQRNTGAEDFVSALWEYQAHMQLTHRGQRMVRKIMGVEDPRLAGGLPRTSSQG